MKKNQGTWHRTWYPSTMGKEKDNRKGRFVVRKLYPTQQSKYRCDDQGLILLLHKPMALSHQSQSVLEAENLDGLAR